MPPSGRNRHSAIIDNQQIACNFQSVRVRQVMRTEHLEETVVTPPNGDATSGL
jgi:hypothetical protein